MPYLVALKLKMEIDFFSTNKMFVVQFMAEKDPANPGLFY